MTAWRKPCVAPLLARYPREHPGGEADALSGACVVTFDYPGTVLHGHSMSPSHAMLAFRWYAETGAAPDSLPSYLPWLRSFTAHPSASAFRAVARARPAAAATLTTRVTPMETAPAAPPAAPPPQAPAPPPPPPVPVVTKPRPAPQRGSTARNKPPPAVGQSSLL